jgi:D-3-phosphoglycerate dehydrogenase / 2-oxoglutarate reductase
LPRKQLKADVDASRTSIAGMARMTFTLITARFDQQERHRLEKAVGPVEIAGFGSDGMIMPGDELRRRIRSVERLVLEFEQVDEVLLLAGEHLKVVACCRNEPAASVDIRVATEHRIPVLFTPGRNAVAVAEYTFGLILSATRSIAAAHHALRYTDEYTAQPMTDAESRRDATAQWSLDPGAPFDTFQGPELFGRTLGIVGFGLIGQEIARIGRGFNMIILAHDPYVSQPVLDAHGTQPVDLVDLAARSDVLVVAAKVTPETRGLISASVLRAMQPTAYFVKIARTALVDYEALLDLLRAGAIAGAALDVYPVEPLPADSPLRALNNVVLSPHLAGASPDVVGHHSRQIVDDLLRLERGERPLHVANPEVLDSTPSAPTSGF